MTRLIIDGNSLLNTGLLRGVDQEFGRKIEGPDGKLVQVNSAGYGVDNYFEYFTKALEKFELAPRSTVLVWDGRNAKVRRRAVLPQYKEGRDKAPEVSEQLNLARGIVTRRTLDLGGSAAQQPGMEADDVMGYLTKVLRNERNVIVTSDGDMSVCVDDNTDVWRLGELSKNPYGPFPHKFITLYKALVGDGKDKIPGATGFGDAKFVDLIRIFGLDGLELMQDLILTDRLDRLREDVAAFPALQMIIDSKAQVALSWRCASLHIDDVNTKEKPLELQAGMVKQWAELDDADRVHELKHFYGTKTLVHAGNYDKALARFSALVEETPFFPLDIETSSSEQSDEWYESLKQAGAASDRFDVLGHELTGMSLTFGKNTQHTIYMTVDHVETPECINISVDQCRQMCEQIPQAKDIVIQNRAFEFSVLYRTWGEQWKNNGWHGMVPNAIDTKIGASYVDENMGKGLKERSLHHLGYAQTSYEQTTQRRGPVGSMTGGAIVELYDHVLEPAVMGPNPRHKGTGPVKEVVIVPAVTEPWERREYKMNQLRAAEVLDYGCDDTICTGALHTHYKFVMDMEQTWDTYLQVEQLPEYLTSLAYVQGLKISLEKVRDMEKKDDAAFEENWALLRTFLISKGWEGTTCPSFEAPLEPADVKLAVSILCPDDEFSTKKRKLNAIAADIREQLPSDMGTLLADMVEQEAIESLNKLLKDRFTGEPQIKFNSPKQLQNLFYNVMGMKPRFFNAMTTKQRDDPVMVAAFKKMRQERDGHPVTYTDEEWETLLSKASTDEDVVKNSLARDNLSPELKAVLEAYQKVRTVMTRRSLFYKTYKNAPHWRDGRVHSSVNQCEAVTRRYSSSNPNLQQLPKRGEGVEFRQVIIPHMVGAVVGSCDFTGQELRLLAEQCKDENLTSCYVGDNLRDVHSLTAVAAAIYLWGDTVTYDEFADMRESKDAAVKAKAKALRDASKTVNFASQYDAQAPNIAMQLMVEVDVAEKFLEAKDIAFPRISPWKDEVRDEVEALGFATTMMGARRHLRESLMSDNSWDRARAGRQGPNFKIQGSGAEQAKLAMASMWRRGLFTGKYRAVFYAPIHDEVVFSVHKDDAVECIREIHECMVQPYGGMTIPIVSSISIGPNFGQQIECGEEFSLEAVNAALQKIFHREEVAA